MNTCATCHWWHPIKIIRKYRMFAICDHEKLHNGRGRDTLSLGTNKRDQMVKPVTGRDFGCVHWEAKK